MSRFSTVHALLLAALAGPPCFAGCFGDDGCEDAGRDFAKSAIWTCSDGCNICTCEEGDVTSTDMACPQPPGPAAGKLKCWSGSYWQTHGDHWTCNDDACSDCSCNDGRVIRETTCGAGGERG
jgi:hypothetical protein